MEHGRYQARPGDYGQQAQQYDYDVSQTISSGYSTASVSSPRSTISSVTRRKACEYCRDKHRACVWAESDPKCARCTRGGYTCVLRERATSTPSQSSEMEERTIIENLEAKDRQINELLGYYTNHSSSRSSPRKSWDIQDMLDKLENIPSSIEVNRVRADFVRQSTSGEDYWREGLSSNLLLRGVINERHRLPDLLLRQVLQTQDANKLFKSFMEKWNHGIGLLDYAIHSPRTVLQRCPLLFTVVMAIASRGEHTQLYERLIHQAKLSAAAVLTDGVQSADTVQALLLMASYPPPVRRLSEDRTYLYVGMAIRMARDLKLDRAANVTPRSQDENLELANHIRTWRACLLLDGSCAIKFGKAPQISQAGGHVEARDARDAQTGFEIRIFKLVNNFLRLARGGNAQIDFLGCTKVFDTDITALHEEIQNKFWDATDQGEPSGMLRRAILSQTIDYARLVVYSFGFTNELERGNYGGGDYLMMCFHAASSLINKVLDRLAPLSNFKYSPDAWFEYAAFSAAFLIKLMRPQFAHFLYDEQRQRIVELVKSLVDIYRSPAVALRADDHVPRLLSQFLENAAHNIPQYARLGGSSRGLSRTARNTPSPPSAPTSGFDFAPGEALRNALESAMPDWLDAVNRPLPGLPSEH